MTRLRVGDRGIVVRFTFTTGTRDFLNSEASRSALRFTQLCVQWAVRGLYPGVNQPERTVHDSPFVAEIRNAWGCILTLPSSHDFTLCTGTTVRLRLKCDGTRAETKFRLSAKRTSPFKSTGASVQSTAGSRGVRISGSNAGNTTVRSSAKSTGYPLHSPVSPSLPLPCVTVCYHISTGLCTP
jgi:hypothetical protein